MSQCTIIVLYCHNSLVSSSDFRQWTQFFAQPSYMPTSNQEECDGGWSIVLSPSYPQIQTANSDLKRLLRQILICQTPHPRGPSGTAWAEHKHVSYTHTHTHTYTHTHTQSQSYTHTCTHTHTHTLLEYTCNLYTLCRYYVNLVITVWRSGLMSNRIFLIWGSNPISSIRSASSSTYKCVKEAMTQVCKSSHWTNLIYLVLVPASILHSPGKWRSLDWGIHSSADRSVVQV